MAIVRDGYTLFYGGDNTFSNMHPSIFFVAGIKFHSVEQFYMYCKALTFSDSLSAAKIMKTMSPKACKLIGSQVRGFVESVWAEKRVKFMRIGNEHKYQQNSRMMIDLLATEGTTLVEASPTDSFWGNGLASHHEDATNPDKWPGENALGFLLTTLREEFK